MQGTQSYVYWKRPWAKWCLLAAGLLQLLALWMSLSDYWEISSVWDHIMSEDAWKSYASQTILSCSIKAFTAALFFGILIVGGAARSEKAARWGEGILLLTLALLWGAAGACFPLLRSGGLGRFWWLLLLLMALGGGVFSLCKSRKL